MTIRGDSKLDAKHARYSFARAQKLYEKNVHPRVALGPDDMILLRQQIRRGDGKKIMMDACIVNKVKYASLVSCCLS